MIHLPVSNQAPRHYVPRLSQTHSVGQTVHAMCVISTADHFNILHKKTNS